MEFLKENYKKIVFTVIMSILSFITLDIKNFIIKFINQDTLNNKDISTVLGVCDTIIKVIILITILIIYLIIIIGVNFNNNSLRRKYSAEDIVNHLKKKRNKEIKKIIIIGYSLSFSETLRFYLNTTSISKADIEIFCPSEDYITHYICEERPIETRINTLNKRLNDWIELSNNKRVNSVKVHRYSSIPIEYGVIINNESAYISNYNWQDLESSYKLDKKPRNDRKMFRITKKNTQLWEIFILNILSKKSK